MLVFAHGARAQSESGWSCDDSKYQNSMQVILTLQEKAMKINDQYEGDIVSDMDKYEVAAFVGNECRGVGDVITVTKDNVTSQRVYLQIYGDDVPDNITFKVYDKEAGAEVKSTRMKYETFTFDADAIINPYVLNLSLLGDVDGDGDITINDAVCIVKNIVHKPNESFYEDVADADADEYPININDAVTIVKYLVRKISRLGVLE